MNAKPKFLVVEDNENDLLLLQHALRQTKLQIPIIVARDGEEAISSLKDSYTAGSPPDLLLLDLNMPKYSGLEVLQWIRAQPNLRRLIVIIFTTSTLPADVSRAYELGVNSYLVKPFDNESLSGLLKALHRYWIDFNKTPDCRPDFS